VAGCTLCALHDGRNKTVFGVGTPETKVLFIGEAPGRDEDLKGEPFVGRAGKLLDKILAAIDLDRSQVYITNILKCRPPNNRDPQESEVRCCENYLKQQIALIQPSYICALGRVSAQWLLQTNAPLGALRSARTAVTSPGIGLAMKLNWELISSKAVLEVSTVSFPSASLIRLRRWNMKARQRWSFTWK